MHMRTSGLFHSGFVLLLVAAGFIGGGFPLNSRVASRGAFSSSFSNRFADLQEDDVGPSQFSLRQQRNRSLVVEYGTLLRDGQLVNFNRTDKEPGQEPQSSVIERYFDSNLSSNKPRWRGRDVIVGIFIIGIILVAMEESIRISKSAVMLVASGCMWLVIAVNARLMPSDRALVELTKNINSGLSEVGGIVLFLLPAMAIVESVDQLRGFDLVHVVMNRLMGDKEWLLLAIVSVFTFFLSALIDNLTSTIIALKVLHGMGIDDEGYRHRIGGLIVIAANAGGAWSPIGDVTTTMLWIQDKISAGACVRTLIVPSLVVAMVPLLVMMWMESRRSNEAKDSPSSPERAADPSASGDTGGASEFPSAHKRKGVVTEVTWGSCFILLFATTLIVCVPVLKKFADLPPWMGMLFGLGIFWFTTDLLGVRYCESGKGATLAGALEREESSTVADALKNVDQQALLFFTGILLAVAALDTAGVLHRYGAYLDAKLFHNELMIASFLGVSSGVIDNVPLVQAAIDMYKDYGVDDPFWFLIALAAGTGGSLLSVGSAAGVMFMSIEKISFWWYLRVISPLALLGFGAGMLSLYGIIGGSS